MSGFGLGVGQAQLMENRCRLKWMTGFVTFAQRKQAERDSQSENWHDEERLLPHVLRGASALCIGTEQVHLKRV